MSLVIEDLFQEAPVFLNVGARVFGDSLREAGYEVVYVDWSPPAGGDARIADLLDELL
jgi:FdrA protein